MSLYDLDKVSFAHGTKTVLRDLSCRLTPGLFYGLIGANGSGKTTLIDLLLGTLTGTGRLHFKDHPLESYSRRELARELALVPQEFKINFDFTVEDIVMMGRHPHIPRFANPGVRDREIVAEVMAELDISDFKERFLPHLSGGEKQRVMVARALAQDTPTLLLDEATSNLDIHHTIKIMRTIRRRMKQRGGTVIAAIHDLNLAAAYCDTIILLNEGRILKIGSVAETLTPELLKQMFNIDCRPYMEDFSGVRQVAFKYF